MRALKLLLLGLLLVSPAQAEEIPESPIVKTSLALTTRGEPAAAVTFTMPEGWHIYWANPGDSGLATSIALELPAGVTAGGIAWPTPERLLTDTIVNYGYSNQVTLTVPLTITKADAAGTVTANVKWLVCHDICIPESATLTAPFPSDGGADIVAAARAQLPTPLTGSASFSAGTQRVVLRVTTPLPLGDDTEFFPLENGIMANDGERTVTRSGQTVTLTFPRGYAGIPEQWNGVLKSGGKGYSLTATQTAAPMADTPDATLPFLLLLAFAGGLLLNLMPCVLPILSLKALALAKKGGATPKEARKQGVSYAAGVIVSFVLIACIMLAIKSAGAAAGWGFQLQQPGFVAALILLMLLVALNLLGAFELPVLFGSLAGRVKEGTPAGSFSTGALAVALATPCTAPFMAPAIGATLSMPALPALAVFGTLGLGMAFPFLLISFWPAALRLLPRPGPWMVRFKQWIAVPILMTAAWLFTVLLQINGAAGILVTALGGGALVALVKITRARGWPGVRLLLGILVITAATILFQPMLPAHTPAAAMPDVPSEPFDETRLQALRDAGVPVFVDATAAWCITCKVNERVALTASGVQTYFREHNVSFMIADWTRGDPAITRYLASFGRNGVPLYVYYPPGKPPVVLPQLLTPSLVIRTLDAANN